ncbi:peptidase C39 family protein [Pseudomonas sp. RIT-PI-S]|uniref:peptidase C39 family protein n=1 Tax=Pseudomonas sp. RIT-PI-S TaxID=3035295 RepID=UPI0021D9EB06|nr:peptidase C39 family protein [Pseudomonas sp. RIT-PI-S]
MPSDILNRSFKRGALALALATLLSSCADLPAPRIGQLPDRVELTAVPFYRGDDDQGAPTALAALLRERGVSVTPGLVAPYLKLPAKPPALDRSMEQAARAYGMVVYSLDDQFQALLAQVAAGNPVLLRYRGGAAFWGTDRYALLVGYDRFKSHVLLRSGEERRQLMTFSDFVSAWQAAGNWAVLVQGPTQLPADVDPARWREAAARLGQAGQEQAAAKALNALGGR